MKILVLLSGGLDSAVVLASLIGEGHTCECIAFDYGQWHIVELDAAEAVAAHYEVPLEHFMLDFAPRKVDDVVFAGRNLMLISAIIAMAQARGFDAVAIGCNMSDWARFPDCRPIFWSGVRQAAEAYGVQVLTPLLHTLKIDIAAWACKNEVPIDLTWSCYEPIMRLEHGDPEPCGKCLACETRQEALAAAA